MVVAVKWSAGLHSSPTNRVRIWPKHTVFSVKFVFEMNEKKQKEAGIGQLKNVLTVINQLLFYLFLFDEQ